jgi:hypothetical protein
MGDHYLKARVDLHTCFIIQCVLSKAKNALKESYVIA